MTDKQLGKLIKEIRKDKNITIEQLVWGLCDDSSLFHFEKGRNKLDHLLMHRVFDRIGIEADEFALMVTEEEYEYFTWKEQTMEALEKRKWKRLEGLLQNEKIAIQTLYNQKIQYQYFYKLKGIWEAEKNRNRKAAVGYIKAAMEQTMPNVLSEKLDNLLLGEQEIHLLMLYLYYGAKSRTLKFSEQRKLYEKLEEYISEGQMEKKKQVKLYPKLVCIWLNIAKDRVSLGERSILCEKAIRLLQDAKRLYDIVELLRLYVEVLEVRQEDKLSYYSKHYENFKAIFRDVEMEQGFRPELLVGRREKLFLITEYFQSARLTKGLTQEKTCLNICEPETYSRIETGKHAPVKKSMYALAERLEIPWCYYRGELEFENLKSYQFWQKTKLASNKKQWDEVFYLLGKLQRHLNMDSKINKQYVEFEKTIAEQESGMITVEKAYKKAKSLLELTTVLPVEGKFRYYTQTELELMAYMGEMLRVQEKYEDGIKLVERVINNQMKSRVLWIYQWNGLDFVLRVLGSLYFRVGRYEDSIRKKKYAHFINLQLQEASSLPEALDSVADNLEHMDERYSEKYKELYRQTYYVADFFDCTHIIPFAKKYYEDNFDKDIRWY